MDYAQVKGFNYQPSYGSSGLELWRNFDGDIIRTELGYGKRYFPGMNAIRLWLSWDAFNRDPRRFAADFETALQIAAAYDLAVMPVLFNRWHDVALDYGGIYIDHFLRARECTALGDLFAAFMDAIVGGHADDDRIFAWDLCNEPFTYLCPTREIPDVVEAEYRWLTSLYGMCKGLGATAPITIGIHSRDELAGIEQIEPISDILSIHPYWIPDNSSVGKTGFEQLLDDYVSFAGRVGKPLVATETCWGSTDDEKRVEIIRYTLSQLKQRQIGWLVYVLHHSLIADAHRPEFGPVTSPGNLSFIEADGELRPGHEIFNAF